jgi:hemerythrin-like domain-containing protein
MSHLDRRRVLALIPLAGLSLAATPILGAGSPKAGDVTPAEDLMREHGVLKRILLIYDEVRDRIATKRAFPPAAVTKAAGIIRKFIEQYHEKLEEEHLFPRFRKRGKLVELVDTLESQHKAGRRVTDQIIALAGGAVKSDADRATLAVALQQFVRMYAPHEAREDTVLFPAIHNIVSPHEYAALGEEFENKEHELFGGDGFESMVTQVAGIEQKLGIYDLDRFTPK